MTLVTVLLLYYISCQINSTVFHIPCDIDIAYHNANIFRSIFDSFLSSDIVLADDFTNYNFSSCQVIFFFDSWKIVFHYDK